MTDPAAAAPAQKNTIAARLRRDGSLPAAVRLIGLEVIATMDASGMAWIGLAQLAGQLGFSYATTVRAVRQLASAGYFKLGRVGAKRSFAIDLTDGASA